MTLTAAWIRKVGNVQELVVSTDSRLRGGYAWDACPKIMKLPRTDALLAFAGETEYAYPTMLQIYNAIDMYERSRTRAQDLVVTARHLVRVCNEMRLYLDDPPSNGIDPPNMVLVLGGFSWLRQEFHILVLNYSAGTMGTHFRPYTVGLVRNKTRSWSSLAIEPTRPKSGCGSTLKGPVVCGVAGSTWNPLWLSEICVVIQMLRRSVGRPKSLKSTARRRSSILQ